MKKKQNKNTTQYAFDTTICKQDMRPPTNNWRQRRTEHLFMREDYHQKLICKRKLDRLSLPLFLSPL
jgi:hypothetical protein